MAITGAAASAGLDPDRASFTIGAGKPPVTHLSGVTGILPAAEHDGRIDLVGAIGRAVLAYPLPARRVRYSARKVKPRSSGATPDPQTSREWCDRVYPTGRDSRPARRRASGSMATGEERRSGPQRREGHLPGSDTSASGCQSRRSGRRGSSVALAADR
jgi:hypothetical protein